MKLNTVFFGSNHRLVKISSHLLYVKHPLRRIKCIMFILKYTFLPFLMKATSNLEGRCIIYHMIGRDEKRESTEGFQNVF